MNMQDETRALVQAVLAKASSCFEQGLLAEAALLCRELLRLEPSTGSAWELLGRIHDHEGRELEAIVHFRQALAQKPEATHLHVRIAGLLRSQGDFLGAIYHLRQAKELGPPRFEVHLVLGCLLRDTGHLQEGVDELTTATGLNPASADAHTNLGTALTNQGCLEEAIAHLRTAVELDPESSRGWRNLLLGENYCDSVSPRGIFADACAYGAIQTRLIPPRAPHIANPDPERRLRVGLVSPDFRQHSVKHFVEDLVDHHDRTRFTFIAYSNLPVPDAVTNRLKRAFGQWRDIYGQTDNAVVDLAAHDNIDILIDLCGHTGNNRLGVFAYRAAPVQITYIGYPGTTGLATMDGRITDAWADPPGMTEPLHTEKLIRLPAGFLCYRPHDGAPAVVPPPCDRGHRSGAITFGTFNHLPKISSTILSIWRELLLRQPLSRLVIKNGPLGDPPTRLVFFEKLRALGLPLDRVELRPPVMDQTAHLASYGDVDVALDTWPYHGTATTCEALWMGVPVVTRAGQSHVSRVGVSLLSQVGLPDLIARTPEEYITRALGLACDRHRLRMLRSTLRSRMRGSPLMDGRGKARAFESALREAWRIRVS